MTAKNYQDGLNKDISEFLTELQKKFPNTRVTSGFRKGATTKQGKASRHASGHAIDVEPTKEIYDYLWNTKDGISLLNKYKLGILDETSEAVMKKTGATGKHYHIGGDSTLVPKAQQRHKELWGEQTNTQPPQENYTQQTQYLPTQQRQDVATLETEDKVDLEADAQKLQEQYNEKEKLFLNEYNTLFADSEQEIPQEEIQQQEQPKVNYLDTYNQVSDFVDLPLAQQGLRKQILQSEPINREEQGIEEIQNEIMKRVREKMNRPQSNTSFNILPQLKSDPRWEYKAPPPQIKIKDSRTTNATTGKPIDPNKDLVSENYDQDTIKRVVLAAKKYGVDPYTALSVGLQETGLGKTDSNIGHIIGKQDTKLSHSNAEEDFVQVLRDKLKYAKKLGIKDENTQLQAYNGLGKIYPNTEQDYHGYKMKQIYGVDVPKEGINMRDNPLYGKRIIDLRDNVLKKNESITNYINTIIPQENPFPTLKTPFQFQQGGQYTQNELDFLSEIAIKDNKGQLKYPGEITQIASPSITMKNVQQILRGISLETGEEKMMYPNRDYFFKNTKNVLEVPLNYTKQELAFLNELNQQPI